MLCGENPEDHEHFLLRCRSLAESRDPFIETIKSVLSQYLGDEVQQCICRDSELLVALILDCTAVELNLRETQREDFCLNSNQWPGDYAMLYIVNGLDS